MEAREASRIVTGLLEWNRKNLVCDADLKKSDLSRLFAESFEVRANGRSYQVDLEQYCAFLNQFRATIRSISYTLGDLIAERTSVAVPMSAAIVRTSGAVDHFEAILILKWNSTGKIVLWHEVYAKRAVLKK